MEEAKSKIIISGVDPAKQNDDFIKFINSRIEILRPKLLDLTRKNPLLSTKFSDRTNSLIRIVDEVPSFLLDALKDGKMRVMPLPSLDQNPKDESTREFKSALTEARLTDEQYLEELDGINQSDDGSADLLAQAERKLKDRVRAKLYMPERQASANLSLYQHALNHQIDPHYELPNVNQSHEDGRHTDKDIQTLLLPDLLERRLNSLHTKDRTWKEEAGINVLHGAFGFLEWQENENTPKAFAPLVLLPVELEKKRTREGQEFWVSGNGSQPEGNAVLLEKFKLDFEIDLPAFSEGQSLDEYIEEMASFKPKGMTWSVKRWASIGVFPSARLAMYHDLDTEKGWNFPDHPTVSVLFGGSGITGGGTPFGDEYEIDQPEVENKIPLLITDADSSQFSTLVDVADGKDLAVEGPPGTGKSQTIINTIGAALAEGKKVLFVAEKSAALDVVRSRLEAFGLGNFILPLQATRSSKEQVVSSIRDRIEMRSVSNPRQLGELTKEFKKIREELGKYIRVLSSSVGQAELQVYQVLAKRIALNDIVEKLPANLKDYKVPNATRMLPSIRSEVKISCENFEKAWVNITGQKNCWKSIEISNLDPFKVSEILDCAKKIGEKCRVAVDKRKPLSQFNINLDQQTESLVRATSSFESIPLEVDFKDVELARRIWKNNKAQSVTEFLEEIAALELKKIDLQKFLRDPFAPELLSGINKIAKLIEKYEINKITSRELEDVIKKYKEPISDLEKAEEFIVQSLKCSKSFEGQTVDALIKSCQIVGNLSREAIKLRGNQLQDSVLEVLIKRADKKVELLQKKRKELIEKFVLSPLPSKTEITIHANILSEAGVFSFLSPKYRKAKKYYLKLSKKEKFHKRSAVTEMLQFKSWIHEVDEINSNSSLQNILEARFDGINTDFAPFLEVFEYYSKIDTEFEGHISESRSLKEFLRSGDNESLFSLPRIDSNHPINSFAGKKISTVVERSDICKKELERAKTAVGYIRENGNVFFAEWEGFTFAQLQELSVLLESFLKAWSQAFNNERIKEILGSVFRGPDTKEEDIVNGLKIAIVINGLPDELGNSILDSLERGNFASLNSTLFTVIRADAEVISFIQSLSGLTNTKPEAWLANKTYQQIGSDMEEASKDGQGLIAYSRFVSKKRELSSLGQKNFLEEILNSINKPCEVQKIFEAVLFDSLAKEVYRDHRNILANYDGIKLDSLRRQFAEIDRKIIKLSRQRLQSKLYSEADPPSGNGTGRKSTYTQMALLNHEVTKKTRYVPVRELTRRSGEALLEIKPCWMMSPLAVAQYIPKDTIEFDLLIIDEASQMTPEDSLGALIRSKQAMIVGDTNQLPPTSFFKKVLEDEYADEDEVVTQESILEMANAAFASKRRRLKWHYRSRHSGLIAFSNQHVYNNDLVVFPSAHEDHPETGVFFKYIKDGLYSSGTNPGEARVIIDGALEFMEKHPDMSLGIVTLNQKQRTLLLEEMDFAFEKNKHALDYRDDWESRNDGLESFFIKNLENVQGDERDAIFIGTVYGPERSGAPVMQRFGPINGIAGKRRLNVLFSRAKKRIVTYSSMTAADIRAEELGNPGVFMLKRWLEYCANGMLESGEITNREPGSEFECHVIHQIKSMGCEAIPQVGVAGYFIDIGVKHPNWPHGFIMGIECDGATYHSSKSARDRDRLREEVLRGLGWELYRIWSTAWIVDPVKEVQNLREAIKERFIVLKNKDQGGRL